MKNTSRNNRCCRVIACILHALVLLLFGISATAEEPSIHVVYPKPDQVVHAINSTFIFGHVRGEFEDKSWVLQINGHDVEVHRDGGFLAFLPVSPGEFCFDLSVATDVLATPIARTELRVLIPEPVQSLSDDTLQIAGDYAPPRGNLVLATGDELPIWFRGTPGCRAWFSIPGVIDSIPMAETQPRQQPYWGESVFGAGAVPESVLVRGIYSGFYVVPESVSVIDESVVYHLTPPSADSVRCRLESSELQLSVGTVLQWQEAIIAGGIEIPSDYCISMNRPDYPFCVRFKDSVQIIRHGPRKGYFAIFQPEGVEALAVGAEGGWYRVQLSHSQFAWVDSMSVERLPKGLTPPKSYLTSLRTYSDKDGVTVKFPLSGKHPFRIYEDDFRTVRVQLFGVTSDTDWIRYDGSDSLIEIARWSQPEGGLYELQMRLSRDIWGYDTYYEGNTFCFRLNRAPDRVGTVWGKTIVIDPGHLPDLGAVGPTGYTEAEANLAISLEVEKMLWKKGANVVMTRNDASDLPLYDRPAIASAHDADMFVSIHNNALPDGVNPFDNYGTSCYYYHPHSMALARAIHTEMLRATGLPDYGLYHGNLAVARPTQYPAVLVECTFMMLPDEEAKLKTRRFRQTAARGIVKGIERFLEEHDRNN